MKKDPTWLMCILVDDPQTLHKKYSLTDKTIIPNYFKFYSSYSQKSGLDIKTLC